MLRKVNDYIAYGQITIETMERLISKRGEHGANKTDGKKVVQELQAGKKLKDLIDPVFRLHPPKRGYKDIKRNYPLGDCGERPDMDVLLKKMM